jgi:NTP pyrophosphatase (non-canonical NTP hydrolase)
MKLRDVQDQMHSFVTERGWYAEGSTRPQTPRSLAISLGVEAAELLECFQWSERAERSSVADELADIVLYAAQLANVIGADLGSAVAEKLERNRARRWHDHHGEFTK